MAMAMAARPIIRKDPWIIGAALLLSLRLCTLNPALLYVENNYSPAPPYPSSASASASSASASFPVVDAVFTYVNGSDPHFIEELSKYGGNHSSPRTDPSRYRDIGQLRYGLRSIRRYAPWIRRIYLVVSDRDRNRTHHRTHRHRHHHQVPHWLNESHPCITIVTHDEIWTDPKRLPTFSSSSIELHLHRIPGAAEHLLSFNDDYALTAPLEPFGHLWSGGGEDDGDGGGQILYEAWDAPVFKEGGMDAYGEALYELSLAFNRRYVRGRVKTRKVYGHVPFLMNATLQREILSALKPEVERALRGDGCRFRRGADFIVHFAYSQYLQETRRRDADYSVVDADDRVLWFESLTDDPARNARTFRNILRWKPPRLFLCLQDAMKEDDPSGQVIGDVHRFYEHLFPERAPWEID